MLGLFDEIGGGSVMSLDGIVMAVLLVVGGFFLVYFGNSTRLMKRVDELTSKVFELQNEQMECHKREMALKGEAADLRAEVVSQQRRIVALESKTGLAPGEPHAGIVVADLRGIIRAFSPSLTPFFKWLPQEVVGKHISVLMPDEEAAEHARQFAAFVSDESRKTNPDKPILTHAKDKLGNRFPVTITLDGWQVGKEGLITALIRERAVAANSGATGLSGAYKFPRQSGDPTGS